MDDGLGKIEISPADLETVAELITMRFPLRASEARRLARMRALMMVTAELHRVLSTYAEHAIVHSQGTAGTSDLSADTAALIRTLRDFGDEIHLIASEYDRINRPSVPFADDREVEPAVRDFMPWNTPTHVACPSADSGMRLQSGMRL